jgi:hypothetical protein
VRASVPGSDGLYNVRRGSRGVGLFLPRIIGIDTPNSKADAGSILFRYEVLPPDVIDNHQEHYRIVQNDALALVATSVFSETMGDRKAPYVGAWVVIINKASGEFGVNFLVATDRKPNGQPPAFGRCLKN